MNINIYLSSNESIIKQFTSIVKIFYKTRNIIIIECKNKNELENEKMILDEINIYARKDEEYFIILRKNSKFCNWKLIQNRLINNKIQTNINYIISDLQSIVEGCNNEDEILDELYLWLLNLEILIKSRKDNKINYISYSYLIHKPIENLKDVLNIMKIKAEAINSKI